MVHAKWCATIISGSRFIYSNATDLFQMEFFVSSIEASTGWVQLSGPTLMSAFRFIRPEIGGRGTNCLFILHEMLMNCPGWPLLFTWHFLRPLSGPFFFLL